MIFSSLNYYWIINFNGDLEKLKYITSAMNYLDEDFDPNPFIYKESLYIKKLLDWEIEEDGSKFIHCSKIFGTLILIFKSK